MRSSKSRSRSKPNRPRTLGNIINRVFDSSGPEGKVRGTPQQLIEKYQQLGRDAQLSNDRVAAENYMQHSEHYTRLLAEAMREMAAEQEARQSQQGQNGNSNQGGNQGGNPNGNPNGNGGGQYGQRGDRPDYRNDGNQQPRNDQPRFDQPRFDQPRGDQPRNDQPRSDNRQDNRPDNRGDQRFEQRNDRQNDRPDNRPDTRPDNRRDNRPDNRAENRRDDRRDDRRATPVDVVTFAEVDDDTGLVETPEARRVVPVEAGAVVQPVSTEVAPAPPDEGAKRARAPRRPRAEPEAAAPVVDGPDAAPEKPARSRGPAKPREAAE